MNIGDAAKEHTKKSIECKVSSSNPASSVEMEFFIDGKKQKYDKRQETETEGSHNGIVRTYVFMFTTNRSQNGKAAECHLKWCGKYNKTNAVAYLNITCKQNFLDDSYELKFKLIHSNTLYI